MASGLEQAVTKAIPLIKKFEGLSLSPYLCPAGIPTIGYGFTNYPNGQKISMKDSAITQAYADDLLEKAATGVYWQIWNRSPHDLNENQLAALISFVYNLGIGAFGASTLLRKINHDPLDPAIRDEFGKWNKAAGVVLRGLVNRRAAESALYFTPIPPSLKVV